MRWIRSPAMWNAKTVTMRPSCRATRPGWPLTVRSRNVTLLARLAISTQARATALRRVEDHCLPLESARTQIAYGSPSAINRLLILNAELQPGRGTVLLLREAIGF